MLTIEQREVSIKGENFANCPVVCWLTLRWQHSHEHAFPAQANTCYERPPSPKMPSIIKSLAYFPYTLALLGPAKSTRCEVQIRE